MNSTGALGWWKSEINWEAPAGRLLRSFFQSLPEDSLRTVQDWEQGPRVPGGPARTFLLVIDREPEAVRRALVVSLLKASGQVTRYRAILRQSRSLY